MCSLQSSDTWVLVLILANKSIVGWQWLYTLKIGPDGNIVCYKIQLVAKGYKKVYGQDYINTFPRVAKITSIQYSS